MHVLSHVTEQFNVSVDTASAAWRFVHISSTI